MGKQQERELEARLQKVILERTAAEERATAAEEKLAALEAKAKAEADVDVVKPGSTHPDSKPVTAVPPPKAMTAPPPVVITSIPNNETHALVEQMLTRIEGLRELLATASIELSQLHADEVALGQKRSRVLTDACALLARAVGATGQAPPPIPSPALEARLSIAPVVDISEMADLIESLRPPRAPKVE